MNSSVWAVWIAQGRKLVTFEGGFFSTFMGFFFCLRIQILSVENSSFLDYLNYIQNWTVYLLLETTDYGHPERAFFQKCDIFGLGQTNWAENL